MPEVDPRVLDANSSREPAAQARLASEASSLDTTRLGLVVSAVENLTHDLLGILMGLGNYAELATLAGRDESVRIREGVRMRELVDDATRATRAIRQVTATGRDDRRSIAVTDLVTSAAAAAQTGIRSHGITLRVEPPGAQLALRASVDDAVYAVLALLELGARCARVEVGETPTGELILAARPAPDGRSVRIVLALGANTTFDDGIAAARAWSAVEALARAAGALGVGFDPHERCGSLVFPRSDEAAR